MSMEQAIHKPIEHHGGVWMWDLVGGGYMKLSHEDADMYRAVKKRQEKRKKAENPREVARQEERNQMFMQGFKIVFAVDSLIRRLQLDEDARVDEILDVKRGAEEEYWKNGKDMIAAEQFKCNAVLSYVEAHHVDLYFYLQNACPWLGKS